MLGFCVGSGPGLPLALHVLHAPPPVWLAAVGAWVCALLLALGIFQ